MAPKNALFRSGVFGPAAFCCPANGFLGAALASVYPGSRGGRRWHRFELNSPQKKKKKNLENPALTCLNPTNLRSLNDKNTPLEQSQALTGWAQQYLSPGHVRAREPAQHNMAVAHEHGDKGVLTHWDRAGIAKKHLKSFQVQAGGHCLCWIWSLCRANSHHNTVILVL